jgi:hypothetical protein
MRTIPDPSRILYGDGEGGDLAIQDLPVTSVRIEDWPTARDLACRVGGPNPSYGANACYSEAHYNAIGGPLENLERYELICFDSVTAISRLSFRWSEQQPEAFARGGKDTRSLRIHARNAGRLHQLQRARDKHIVFIGIIEKITDEFNRHLIPAAGGRPARAARDQRHRRRDHHHGVVELRRRKTAARFCCTSPNRWAIQPRIAAVASTKRSRRISES